MDVLDAKTEAQLKKRLRIAREFIKRYSRETAEIEGAVLVGSTNIGVTDEHSDIDILVVASSEAVSERKAVGEGYNETYTRQNVDICVDWHSLGELEGEMAEWKNDATLWSLSRARVLSDKDGKIKKLLKSIRPYAREIRKEKLFLRFYWLSYCLDTVETAIKRHEYETAAFHVYSSVKELTEILFLIENRFIPIEKWRFHELKNLKLGKELLPKIKEIMCIAELTPKELREKLVSLKTTHEYLRPHLLAAGIQEDKIGVDWWRFEPSWNVG